ncbi:MAG: trypsin-like peptidase domain-containing protein [Clostridia bacterium]
MENNNGFRFDFDKQTNYSQYEPQDTQPEHAKRKNGTVSTKALISLVVIVALICGSLGAGITYMIIGSNNSKSALNDNNGDVQQSTTPVNGSQQPNTPVSQGLNIDNSTTPYSSSTQMLQTCMSAVVGIDIEATSYDVMGGQSKSATSSGSGVILTADGYIVTNNHVVDGANKITVYLQDGTKYEAKLVGADAQTDLAVIKIAASGLPVAVLGTSSSSAVGDSVYAIGNPLGVLACSVSDGIISGLDRTIEIDGKTMTLMQTNAAVNPGNSGGGLFNANGKLVGIVNAKSSGIEVEGLGFAIPIDVVKPIVSDLMDYGFVSGRPYIGISMQNVSLTSAINEQQQYIFPFGLQQTYVTRAMIVQVEEGSAAQKSGLKENDIILAFNGTDVQGYAALSSMLYEYKAGDVVTITVLRGNEQLDISLTLGDRATTR